MGGADWQAGSFQDPAEGRVSMYLWNREMQVAPEHLNEGVAGLVDAITYVNGVSAYEFRLWATVLGTFGRLGVGSTCDDFGAFSEEMATRGMEDESFRSKVDAVGKCLAGNPEDSVWNVIHTTGDAYEVRPVIAIIDNQWETSQMGGVVAATIDMADHLNSLAGTPVTVAVSTWGTGPSVRMMFGYDTVGQVQERTAVAMVDPGFQELGRAFNAEFGSTRDGRSSVLRRIV